MKEAFKRRKAYFLDLFNKGKLIINGDLYNYTQDILNKITNIKGLTPRKLFIVRANDINAFNMGDNSIFINLGMISAVNSEAELAMVIAHELGHNELQHYDNSVIEHAQLIANDSINKRIKKISKSPYGQVSAINKLMIPWLLKNKENSRTHENEADNFAFDCLISLGYNMTEAYGLFETFKEYKKENDTLNFELAKKFHLNELNEDFNRALNTNTESSLGTFSDTKQPLQDLLRTHPFSHERAKAFLNKLELKPNYSPHTSQVDYSKYKSIGLGEIIVDAIHNGRVDNAIYYSFELLNIDSKNQLANNTIPLALAFLGYEKLKRRSGKRVDIQSPYYGQPLNQLIYFLREISPNQCFSISKNWQDRMNKNSLSDNNPYLAIIDIIDKNYDKFEIRYDIELNKSHNYHIKKLLTIIQTENKQ